MSGPLVVPVSDIDRSFWSQGHVARSEPGVVRHQQIAGVGGAEGRAPRLDVVPVDIVAEQVSADVFVSKAIGKGVAAVDDAANGDVSAVRVAVRSVIEVAVGVRVVQGAVLAEQFPVVAALDAVQQDEAAVIGAVEKIAVSIEVKAPGVAAALAEQLELARARVIAPDALLEL